MSALSICIVLHAFDIVLSIMFVVCEFGVESDS